MLSTIFTRGLMMSAAIFTAAAGGAGLPFPNPKDWTPWTHYRDAVRHPCTTIQADDLRRARENIEAHAWARSYRDRIRASADAIVRDITPEYLENMAEITTPGCTGPCPACRDRGLRWHPNGQWSWNPRHPNQITCKVCHTVFPNEKYPESIVLRSTWDPRQKFRFYGGKTFHCFGYRHARPTFTGIIRAKKFQYLSSQLHTVAIAYALGADPRYARAARAILLRIAKVLPHYLVRAGYGYGEFTDCDPHTACERIENLPNDELVYPPNKPNRKLYAGYWAASRVGTSGMDGGWVARVTLAYDLTCEAMDGKTPVYSRDDRLRIERDVLLEGSYLAACDPRINNKSVGNRAGAAMVGLCVGHPGLVRFGLDGFLRTVDDWFLPDGGTSESAAYAMMTMHGIRPFGLAFRDYSEPPGFTGPDGKRLEHFNACRDTSYGTCWQGLLWTLQGNLRHPPLADSYRNTSVSAPYAELVALAYPTPQHLAYLHEVAGDAPGGSAAGAAIFYRAAALDTDKLPPFSLPDVVFPFLSQGFLRLGRNGRRAAVVLNASDWGGHHHYDSLNLYLWQDGHELLSDLGYLWDHPDKHMTYRTAAHNLVMIDGREQERRGRGGSFHLFAATPFLGVMEASSRAYPKAAVYRRTCLWIKYGPDRAYLVDIFRAGGGKRRDYLFHGPNLSLDFANIAPQPLDRAALPDAPPVMEGMTNPRAAASDGGWHARWKITDEYGFTAWAPANGPRETVSAWDGWGQRDHRNTDRGVLLPYLFRSRTGNRQPCDVFTTVFEGAGRGRELVRGARLLPLPADAAPETVVLETRTAEGTDLIISRLDSRPLRIDWNGLEIRTDARAACISRAPHGAIRTAAMVEGSTLVCGDLKLEAPARAFSGDSADSGSAGGNSWFDVRPRLPESVHAEGAVLFVTDANGGERAYPIHRQEPKNNATRLYTEYNHVGFPARPAQNWRLDTVVEMNTP